MIFVIATIQISAGKRADFLREFHALVPLVRAEEGCIEYLPTIDVATSLPRVVAPRETVVTIMEKWRDLAALEAHLVAPHMAEYRERVKDLVQGAELQILEPA